MAERRAYSGHKRGIEGWQAALALTIILTVLGVEYLAVRGPIVRAIHALERGRYHLAVQEAKVASARAFEPLMQAVAKPVVREVQCLSEWDAVLARSRNQSPAQCLSILSMACMDLPKWPRAVELRAKSFDLAIDRARDLCTLRDFDIGTEFLQVAEALACSREQSERYSQMCRVFRDFEQRFFLVAGLDHAAIWTRIEPASARLVLKCPDGLGPFLLTAGSAQKGDGSPEITLTGSGGELDLTGLLAGPDEAAQLEQMQIGGHDLNGDTVPELFLAASLEGSRMLVILRLDRGTGSWQPLLNYRWRGNAVLGDGTVQFHRTDGAVTEYHWIRGRFVVIP